MTVCIYIYILLFLFYYFIIIAIFDSRDNTKVRLWGLTENNVAIEMIALSTLYVGYHSKVKRRNPQQLDRFNALRVNCSFLNNYRF